MGIILAGVALMVTTPGKRKEHLCIINNLTNISS